MSYLVLDTESFNPSSSRNSTLGHAGSNYREREYMFQSVFKPE